MAESKPRDYDQRAYLDLERKYQALQRELLTADRDLITYAECRRRYGFGLSWLRDNIAAGNITAFKLGPRAVRISAASVQAYLDRAPRLAIRPAHRR
jgi:hypothetical protein